MSSEGADRMLTALGMMSGTSMDGIDVAMLRTDGDTRIERGPFHFTPYPSALRRRIEAGLGDAAKIERRSDRPGDLEALESELTTLHAAAAESFLVANGFRAGDVDLVGVHGQTVLHRPERSLTVQLLDAGSLARSLGLRIVHDMRQLDIEAGGQGAPLVPVYHRALARGVLGVERDCVAFVNIGGIANVTFVTPDDLVAFDTGPGNALIDQWMQSRAGLPFDDGGRIAMEGGIDEVVVKRLLASSYFEGAGPKSLDRNDFLIPENWDAELSDGARTLARITAASIARSAEHAPREPVRWIISGGGAQNAAIITDLEKLLAPATVEIADEIGLSSEAMEAEAWAYLAVRIARGLPISEPGTTGRRSLALDRAKFADWI